MKTPLRYLDEAQCKWIGQWWQALQPTGKASVSRPADLAGLGRAGRARLKRCTSLDELLLIQATHCLAGPLLALEAAKNHPRFKESDYECLALLAGGLAQVASNAGDGASLPAKLGMGSVKPRERPPLSELRFRRLQRARDTDDFYRQLSRALKLAKGTADITVLADDLMAWGLERKLIARTSSHDLKFRWARDYYLPASTRAID